ncbi:MAG TPA: peroxidase-related enzyme [bacterium]|nr:peroxidase-related enzyme [bacterium]
MPLIPTPDFASLPENLQRDTERMRQEPGSYLEVAQLYMGRPDLYDAVGKCYDAFFRNPNSALSEEERELTALVVSLLTSTRYGAEIHRQRIARLNLDPAVLQAVEDRDLNSPTLSHRQRAFLNFARKMAAFPHTIVDKDIIYLQQNGFDDAGILELGALSAYVKMLNTMTDAFKVEAGTPAHR